MIASCIEELVNNPTRIRFLNVRTGTPQVNLYFDGAYQGWKDLISSPTVTYEYIWTGLSGDQTDVDNMQVRFKSSCAGVVKFNSLFAL